MSRAASARPATVSHAGGDAGDASLNTTGGVKNLSSSSLNASAVPLRCFLLPVLYRQRT